MALTSPPPAAPEGIEVRRVETWDDFLASREVQWEAFDVPEERRELQRPHLRADFEESVEHGRRSAFSPTSTASRPRPALRSRRSEASS